MYNPGIAYIIILLGRAFAAKKKPSSVPAKKKRPFKEAAKADLAQTFWFVMCVAVSISVGFGILYAASYLFENAGKDDIYYSPVRFGLIFPVLLVTFAVVANCNDLVRVLYGNQTRDERRLSLSLLTLTFQKRRKWTIAGAVFTVIFSLGLARAHVRVTNDTFAVQPFYKLTEVRHSFDSIRELVFFRGFRDSHGKVVQTPSAQITFEDGSTWSSVDWQIAMEYDYAKKIIQFLSQATKHKFTVKELRE